MANPVSNMTDEQQANGRTAATAAKRRAADPAKLLDAAGIDATERSRESILFRLRQMPQGCRTRYIRAMRGRSAQAGVIAFCQMCIGYARGEVANCSDPACHIRTNRHPIRLH